MRLKSSLKREIMAALRLELTVPVTMMKKEGESLLSG